MKNEQRKNRIKVVKEDEFFFIDITCELITSGESSAEIAHARSKKAAIRRARKRLLEMVNECDSLLA